MTSGFRRGWPALGLVVVLSLAACGSSTSAARPVSSASAAPSSASATPSPSLTPTPSPAPKPTPTIDPGTLPQTDVRPATDALFTERLNHYWTQVLRGYAGPGSDFFFPRAAYLQLKTLSEAGADYDTRLYHDYANDVKADHELVTSLGRGARVLGVDIPEGSVRWVPPGVEYNSIGYWQVSYPRVRYVVAGQEHSYAISSMISWRGQWYVVHLGPNWRPGAGGWVCTPEPATTLPISAACLRG